jgi:small subunit ribosomal protein S8
MLMRQDILSDVLSAIKNGDRVGKRETVTASSKMVKEVLLILQKASYIGEFELVEDGRGGKFKITLLGRINAAGPIRPRFSVKKDDYEKWERRYLPAAGMGFLIVSTSAGVITHDEAKAKKLGGKLLGYIY